MPIQIQRVHRANLSQPLDAEQHQKKLDDQLVKANFDDITVSELKEMLRQRGKPATGKKAVLLQRLLDERDMIKALRGGKITHRHSQPPLSNTNNNNTSSNTDNDNNNNNTSTRPLSYQGTSPMISHNALSPRSPLIDSPSSVPNSSMFLSSSPGSTFSLNRSIANMHIGSPPMTSQQARRFTPYGTPGSPRIAPSSPKLPVQKQAYSSSMPTNYLSSSPNNNNAMDSHFNIQIDSPNMNNDNSNSQNNNNMNGNNNNKVQKKKE